MILSSGSPPDLATCDAKATAGGLTMRAGSLVALAWHIERMTRPLHGRYQTRETERPGT